MLLRTSHVLFLITISFILSACGKRDNEAFVKRINFKLPNKQSLNNSWQSTIPGRIGSFNCFGIMAEIPDLSANTTCENHAGATIGSINAVSGFGTIGSTFSMDILTGSNRKFYVVGMYSSSGSCPSFSDSFDELDLSPPYILGEATLDIFSSTDSVNLTASHDSFQSIKKCTGSLVNFGNSIDCDAFSTVTSHLGIGSGTATDPYIICNATQLYNLGQTTNTGELASYYKLESNIDLSAYTGTAFSPIGDASGNAFTGNFNGNFHTVSNLIYSYAGNITTNTSFGFFGLTNSATIENLSLTGVNINLSNTSANTVSVGGLVASLQGAEQIRNIYLEGTVFGEGGNANSVIGGMFGLIGGTGTNIKSCGANVNVTAGSLNNGNFAGGFFGAATPGATATIENSYAIGNVVNNSSIGKTAGFMAGYLSATSITISNSYAATSMTFAAGGTEGGFTSVTTGLTGTNNFYDSTLSGQSDTNFATPLTTSQMQTAATFSAWDNLLSWFIKDGAYPSLTWR